MRLRLRLAGLGALGVVAASVVWLWSAAGAEASRMVATMSAGGKDAPTRAAELEQAVAVLRPALAAAPSRLEPLAPLLASERRADAGPLLNALVEWPLPWPGRPRPPLSLPDEVVERLAAWGEGDVKRLAGIDLERLDLSWMAQLDTYDHWDLEHHSPLEGLAAGEPRGALLPDEEPHLERLTPWVKLRLMKGLADADPLPALSETRKLIRLLLSTQSLLGSIEAMVLLRLERQAWVAAVGSRPDMVEGWPGVGSEETPLVAVSWLRALPAVLGLEASDRDFDAALRGRAPGLCAALREATRTALALRPLLEESRAAEYRRLAAAASSLPECRLGRLEAALRSPSLTQRLAAFARLDEEGRPLAPAAPAAPLLRRLAFLCSPPLRAAAGEALLHDATLAALVAAAQGR